MAESNYYYYEPSKGHGLPHNPINSIIGPRPIGWISTQGRDGTLNLAPYSFTNTFNYHPLIIGFTSTGVKDSLRNVQQTGEFVWNLATRDLAEKMNMTSEPVPYEVDEFKLAGLTHAASRHVAVPRVAESAVHVECKLSEVIQLHDREGSPVPAWLVLGEAVAVHIRRDLLKDGVFDTFGAGLLLRAGGASDYASITPDNLIEMERPGGADHPAS